MTRPLNGSKPGPISRTVSYRSIAAPRSTHVNDECRDSFSTLSSSSSAEPDYPGEAWMEKENIDTQSFRADVESLRTKEASESQSRPTQLSLSLAPTSQWQVAPAPSIPSADGDATYPEGGLRAWLVVLGSFSGMMAAFGFMNTMGAFQTYVSQNQLKDYNESTIGWIFSFFVFLSFFCGLQIGPVFDAKGPFWLIMSGSVLLTAATLLLGLCHAYWQFMLVIGLMAGFGVSLIFTPSVSAVGHFFLAKRGAATGIAAMGGSVGGVVFPLTLQTLIPRIGFAWATRVMGLIIGILCLTSVVLVRSRLPPKPGSSILPDIKIFKDPAFAFVTTGVFFMEFALFIPVSYISSFVVETQVENAQRFGYQLLAILNAGSTLGRWLPGVFSDRIGRYNSMILMLGFCCLTTLAFWLPASWLPVENGVAHPAVKPLIIVYAVIFGFASGSNISLTPVCVGQLCDTEEYGRYYATCYTVVSFGTLTGIPIAGALIQACGGKYYGVALFTGASYIVSFICMFTARVLKAGWKLKVMY
ncbi:uncharacterized protein PV09_00771 [Verruconis gallopava]|uniref:Major facilitator superfamily (MFS) profile domain-containing protein n=1 Tax=Verruconis gallopava TaxID=253628 RepID=A0A0D2AQN8_9PEZI|nr:uncharacterized protein PV09_00771 [Verruconis gallopava]KIW08845.1 hypothetical protein PV09_00771 [Verruconis gallopava]